MSNKATIQLTEFKNYDLNLESNSGSYFGFRIYDDHGMAYSTIGDSKEAFNEELDEFTGDRHIQLIKLILEKYHSQDSEMILDHIREEKKGINICDTWYDWDEIKQAFEEAYEVV